ncbi:hypothetical protein GCM10010517_61550 [Streptosporangium fragile]|uniref:Uncharacterized protein n=1 Tax=Streptosporangium fragile TaxID=46186 RepID=A0ABP6ILT8_9ACTN
MGTVAGRVPFGDVGFDVAERSTVSAWSPPPPRGRSLLAAGGVVPVRRHPRAAQTIRCCPAKAGRKAGASDLPPLLEPAFRFAGQETVMSSRRMETMRGSGTLALFSSRP